MSAKIKYVVANDAAGVDKLIDAAVKSISKARVQVQVALVAILIHAAKHNDYSRANTIVERLVGTVNANAIVKWFVEFGGLIVSEDGTGFNDWQGPDYIRNNLDAAKETMWFEFTKPNPFAGYNAEAELHKFMKRYATMQTRVVSDELDTEAKAKVDLHIDPKTIDALMKLAKMELVVAPDMGTTEQDSEATNVAEHPTREGRKAA